MNDLNQNTEYQAIVADASTTNALLPYGRPDDELGVTGLFVGLFLVVVGTALTLRSPKRRDRNILG